MRYLVLGLLVLMLGSAAWGADLLAVDSAFYGGQYEQAELLALRALQDPELSRSDRARLNLTAGYAVIMLGRESDGREYFARALEAVPDLTLDPVQVSPRFRMVFDEVKAARGTAAPAEAAQVGLPRGALLANLLIPGSGQWLTGHRVRGALFFAAQVGTDILLLTQLSRMRDSRADYLAEADAARMDAAYDRYNDDYRAAWATGIAAGVIYVAAQADLIRLHPRTAHSPQLTLTPASHGLGFSCRW